MLVKTLIGLAAAIAVVGFLAQITGMPEPLDPSSRSHAMLQHGPHAVVREQLTLVDERRRLAGATQVDAPRSIDLRIWYPERAPAAAPLVLYSHGMMGSYDEGVHYAEHFASHGYTFVAPNFPYTNFSNGQQANAVDVINQPGDIAFILDTLLQRNEDSDDPLYQRIDSEKIVAMGLSLGGMTTHMLAFDPLRADARFDAAVAIAAPSEMFSAKFFATRDIPYLAIAAPQDAFIDYQRNALPMLERVPGSTLVSIDGGSHTGFADQARWLRWLDNPDSVGCSQVKDNIDATAEQSESWYPLLGSIEQGYIIEADVQICEMVLAPALNPVRQGELTLLAAWSFLQCQFSAAPAAHCDFLARELALENNQVSVVFAQPR